ncbi:serine O-acetyltransferase [Psychrobacter sp.]|uniref:serine O-acetyltransferase n=1 Tax=Psychrobacter sp. TaxID=56811 RepID=UPI003F9E662B
MFNPSFHAVALIRLAQFSPSWLFWVWRNTLIMKHSIDIGRGFHIEKGLRLPHPIGIVIGGGARIGNNVTLYHFVTLGKNKGCYPTIEDNVIIFTSSVVVGPIKIGEAAIIGALSYISKDVSANEIVKRER